MRRFFMLLLLCFTVFAFSAQAAAATPALQFEGEKFTLNAEDVGKLTVTISPEETSMPALEWKSSDETVLRVEQDGTITALKQGSAKVTVSAVDGSAKSATCRVKVKKSTRVPIKAPIEGNVYTAAYTRADQETEKALREYCEKLGKSRGEKIVRAAVERIGTPYASMDCSKLAQIAYKENGISIPRTSGAQAESLAKNVREDGVPRIGDMYFMQFPSFRGCSCGQTCTRYRKIHHSAIFLGVVNNRSYVVDSSSHYGCVIIREFNNNTVAGMPVVCIAGK